MVELKYIGKHQPEGMIVDVDEDRVDKLLKEKDFVLRFEEKKVEKVFNDKKSFKVKKVLGEENDNSE